MTTKTTEKTCYMCAEIAVEDEHVPPRCIFPEGAQWRRELIKVPSCEEHNSMKSKDDAILRHYLASADGNNELAHQIYAEKVIPRLEERPHIMETFLPNLRPINVSSGESGAYTVDLKRFEKAIGCIVRGLYFKGTGNKLTAEFDVFWAALRKPDLSQSPFTELFEKGEVLIPPDWQDANPRVFRYSFHYWPEHGNNICRLQFYEGPPIFVIWGKLN